MEIMGLKSWHVGGLYMARAGWHVGGACAVRHCSFSSPRIASSVLVPTFRKARVPEIESPGVKKPLPEGGPEGRFLDSVLSMAGSNN